LVAGDAAAASDGAAAGDAAVAGTGDGAAAGALVGLAAGAAVGAVVGAGWAAGAHAVTRRRKVDKMPTRDCGGLFNVYLFDKTVPVRVLTVGERAVSSRG
jgi:hypothetical protein